MSLNTLRQQPEISSGKQLWYFFFFSGQVSHLTSALQSTFQLLKAEKATNKQQPKLAALKAWCPMRANSAFCDIFDSQTLGRLQMILIQVLKTAAHTTVQSLCFSSIFVIQSLLLMSCYCLLTPLTLSLSDNVTVLL